MFSVADDGSLTGFVTGQADSNRLAVIYITHQTTVIVEHARNPSLIVNPLG